MKSKTKPANVAHQHGAGRAQAPTTIKQSLLLALGTVLPCGAAIIYAIQQLEEPGGAEEKKVCLLFGALALPLYVIVLLLKGSIDAKREQKKITAMVTELTEGITMDKGSLPGRAIQSSHHKADALVQKIVQAINA